jgi:predicted peptidase
MVKGSSRQRDLSHRTTVTQTIETRYLLYLPPGYDDDPDKKWPLLLFLHGAGERGDDLELVKVHGPPKHIDEGRDFPFIVISPQCREGVFWQPAALLDLLDEMIANYRVDESRQYVTGLSMGGFGSFELTALAPRRFAAVVAICGGIYWPHRETLVDTPIWAFHGDADDLVPFNQSGELIEWIQANGGNAKLTVYPGVGHESWHVPYGDDEIFDWLLAHRREA